MYNMYIRKRNILVPHIHEICQTSLRIQSLQVKCSHELCARAKVPSMGFAETAGTAFKYGPEKLRGMSKFAK